MADSSRAQATISFRAETDAAAMEQPTAAPRKLQDEGTPDETLLLSRTSARVSATAKLTEFLAPAQAADEIGRLGPYRVLRILGHGGMGCVYLADDVRLARRVALKVMLPEIAVNEAASQRFLREARAMAQAKHPQIATIYQVDEDRGIPFLAMEFLEGESLDDRLKRENTLPVSEILRIGRQIADGLHAAHKRGLIHRDIKPGNIWLETRDDDHASSGDKTEVDLSMPEAPFGSAVVKILDFGLARSGDQEMQLTQSGAIVGTPAYMAPEQARGGAIDARSDLFSLGCVLYRMVTGVLPFHGADTISTLMAIATDEPLPPNALNTAIPDDLSRLILKLLAKAPQNRFQSAKQVSAALSALERIHGDLPTAAPTKLGESGVLDAPSGAIATPSIAERIRTKLQPETKPRLRVGTWIAISALGLLAAVGFGAYRLIQLAPQDGEREPPAVAEKAPDNKNEKAQADYAEDLRAARILHNDVILSLLLPDGKHLYCPPDEPLPDKQFRVIGVGSFRADSPLTKKEILDAVAKLTFFQSFDDWRPTLGWNEDDIQTLSKSAFAPRLTRLSMKSDITQGTIGYLSRCPNLDSLALDFGKAEPAIFPLLAERLPGLRSLEMSSFEQLRPAAAVSGLEELRRLPLNKLTLIFPRVADPVRFCRIIARFPVLNTLHVHGIDNASVMALAKAPNIGGLAIGGGTVDDTGLHALVELATLRGLQINGCDGVTEKGIAEFVKAAPSCQIRRNGVAVVEPKTDLPGAELIEYLKTTASPKTHALDMAKIPFDPANLGIFNRFPEVRSLDINVADFDDATFRSLVKACPKITRLSAVRFETSKIAPASFGLLPLKKLTIGLGEQPSALVTTVIGGSPDLEELFIWFGSDNEGGLRELTKSQKLHSLSWRHGIVDLDLGEVAKIRSLRFLDLRQNDLTERGIQKLAAALPQCRIEWDGGVIPPRLAEKAN